ncbi:MAG TPA: hypothetical protein VEW03_14250 [Longimicrobiaceae bacterium]|nr:hypothetical protein [Longimicrobiaceae bacterium]
MDGIARVLCMAVLALLAACGRGPGDLSNPKPEVYLVDQGHRSNSVWVVMGEQMLSGGTVLDGISSRIPNLDVRRTADCPDIFMRGRNALQRKPKPQVYVDGQRAADTCILAMMRAGDINRVELYPSGFSNRAGYVTDSDGLILVFTRSAIDEN